ncbi:hypothetical protein SAMN04488121_102988 [Chitinophaga filiformis]|uniref:Uncharacterized protein n=1 Tax=Chitinophaga filiformis TaxID=104663 RepID=A0A1G7NYE1_CHIFI|nr:hypothetical protein SAMN04488121_102988 [Chitinophaga filiformis]
MEKLFIPNQDHVFCRVGVDFISSKDNKPRASAFRNTPVTGNNLSCDWDRYCTAESSRALIGRQVNVKTEIIILAAVNQFNSGGRQQLIPAWLQHLPLPHGAVAPIPPAVAR